METRALTDKRMEKFQKSVREIGAILMRTTKQVIGVPEESRERLGQNQYFNPVCML